MSPSHSCLRVNAELPPPGPSISVSPSGVIVPGRTITIRCQCWCEARRLLLDKGGIRIQEVDADGDGGEFIIPRARQEDGGIYSCRSRSRSEPPNWSDPSDSVRIVVAGERSGLASPLPPSISLHPSGRVALGGTVTVQCRGRHQNMRFLLYKDGNPNVLQDVEPAGDLAEFPIRNVSWRDAGSYSCYYHDKWYLFIWSRPSDSVELVVAGEGPGSVSSLPAPHPARPSGARACSWGATRVLLSKAGDPNARRAMDSPAGDVAEFPICNVSQRDAGSYRCRYSTKSDPPMWSEPSDPVELVVAGEGPARRPRSQPHTQTDPQKISALRAMLFPEELQHSLSQPHTQLDLQRVSPRWDAQSQALPWAQQRGCLVG
uniref:Ig-like domain-containing protein n=1 Tax=Chrysemys picta bellii TaxID=8478 RepID=A0A8C3HP81_CHRPI